MLLFEKLQNTSNYNYYCNIKICIIITPKHCLDIIYGRLTFQLTFPFNFQTVVKRNHGNALFYDGEQLISISTAKIIPEL